MTRNDWRRRTTASCSSQRRCICGSTAIAFKRLDAGDALDQETPGSRRRA